MFSTPPHAGFEMSTHIQNGKKHEPKIDRLIDRSSIEEHSIAHIDDDNKLKPNHELNVNNYIMDGGCGSFTNLDVKSKPKSASCIDVKSA